MANNSIPSNYSDKYIHRRYNRALQIVQHLPNHFQPTKEQKLKLYAFYKQVSLGDVEKNTPRPGLFDIVGRAKWDAWNNIKGMTKLEAEHKYVETLLQTVSEAFQNPACRAQAQQILQIFATLKPTGDDDDTTDDDITTTTEDDQDNEDEEDDEGSSQGSIDEEEKAYLFEIQQNAGRSTPATVFRQKKKNRLPLSKISLPNSSSSQQQHSNSSQQSLDRPITPTTYSKRSFNNNNNNLTTKRNMSSPLSKPSLSSTPSTTTAAVHIVPPRDSPYYNDDDQFDNTVNPWVAVSGTTSTSLQSDGSKMKVVQLPILIYPQSNDYLLLNNSNNNNGNSNNSNYNANNATITSLSPATKRALQALQAEVIALNDRIDDLRHELLRRDKQRSSNKPSNDKSDKDGDGWEESWKWVINAALKYFAVNILTASIMFLILYKRKNTVAYVIVDEFTKMWHKFISQPNRTQRKLSLQRQWFLANDKNYLDHPTNMKRLTKEINRVNKEYTYLLQYEDPLHDSFKRLVTPNLYSPISFSSIPSSSSSSTTTSSSSSSFSSTSFSVIPNNISPAIRSRHKLLLNKLQQQ
ncbi:acyl CoA binding protein-domain-containing protein [Cunninghamella echinulata]|nr:acyl CoA binding protein-domain-containing protein [Cunninghamella echinulata]